MTTTTGQDTLKTRQSLNVNGKIYDYFSLKAAQTTLGDISRLPFSLKVLMENLLRFEDGRSVTETDIRALAAWLHARKTNTEVAYRPARVLMQDFTGVPAVVDLAAMREATIALGGDPQRINPLCAVDLVIDHSVMVDEFGSPRAFANNVAREFERNGERYAFLRWGQKAFNNFRVVPPGTGICHQVNLEYLAQTVWVENDSRTGTPVAYPDTLVGTDSHTTMVNGLGVLGWGVGGIEAEAAMLGQPVSMLIPEVVGFKLIGKPRKGVTATDIVLTVTQTLRKMGVVNKFVEFYGPGLDHLRLADRATIANMAPEYGATCGLFPIDAETINYLTFTGRDPDRIALVEAYAKEQGMWREQGAYDEKSDPVFSATAKLDLASVEPSLAGPRLPQERVLLTQAASKFQEALPSFKASPSSAPIKVADTDYALTHGHVVIAAITSCTNTSNPGVMLAAGILARKARQKGLTTKPWVKTSLAPGSQVVTDYLIQGGLQTYLDALGFHLVGYGCTTCIGNSGPLPENVAAAIEQGDLVACAVLSGNRNFEGRINPHCKANYLASPPLVVAYALAGSMTFDFTTQPLGKGTDGKPVFLRDLWPTNAEIDAAMSQALTPAMFQQRYANVFDGPEAWQKVATTEGQTYAWDKDSTYVKQPPLFDAIQREPQKPKDVANARLLAMFGDSITTDHISPAGDIQKSSPAGAYLTAHGIAPSAFNSYGARRGNHEVMMRGTFANIRIKNELMDGVEGGSTKHFPSHDVMPIYDAAMRYQQENVPLIVVAGKEYGTGSSRDWAAKGTKLLGVRAVIAESFERIHRSNLVGMGVLPLEFKGGMTRADFKLTGEETFGIAGIATELRPHMDVMLTINRKEGVDRYMLLCRIDTLDELEYFKHGGILPYMLRDLLAKETS